MRFLGLLVLLFVATLIALATRPATAASVVYDNGPIMGHNGLGITGGYELTNSFTVNLPNSLTGAQNIGLWVDLGQAAPTDVQWKIGTAPFGSDLSSGTSTLSTVLMPFNTFETVGRYDVYASSMSLSGMVAANTTYWFTLYNAHHPSPGDIWWDLSNGPSQAFHYIGFATSPIGSESFQLLGNQIPEPSTLLLAIAALATLLTVRR